MLVWRLGWRNVWRNRRRSLLAIAAVAVAFATLMTLESLRAGLARQLLDSGTRLIVAHVQVHAIDYLPSRGIHATIGGDQGTSVPMLIGAVESVSGVVAAAPRVLWSGLLSTGDRSAGARLLGIESERESRVSSLTDAVTEGSGLAGAPPNSVLLGTVLAQELGAGVGSEVAVVTQSADGTIGNELLRVRGLVRTGLLSLDRSLALLALSDLQALLALGSGRIHELAVRVAEPGHAEAIASRLSRSGVLPPDCRADSWERIVPSLADYLDLLTGSTWIMVAIVGTFVLFGVLNTMLMAVLERTREIGVLVSLGLTPSAILAMIVAESLCVTAVGLAVGLALGTASTAYLVWHGWDLTRWTAGLTVAGVLIDPVMRGGWAWRSAPWIALTIAALGVVAGLAPAVRAARMKPVEALLAPGE